MSVSLAISVLILTLKLSVFGQNEHLVPYKLGGITIMVDPSSIGLNSPLMSHLIKGMPSRIGQINDEKDSNEDQEVGSANFGANNKYSANLDNNVRQQYINDYNQDGYDNGNDEGYESSDSSKIKYSNYGSDFVKSTDGKLAISINPLSPIAMGDAGGIYNQEGNLQHTDSNLTNPDFYYSPKIPSIENVSQTVHKIVSDLNSQSNDRYPIKNSQHRSPPIPNAEPIGPEMFSKDPRPFKPAVQTLSFENTDGFAEGVYDPVETSNFEKVFSDKKDSATTWVELNPIPVVNVVKNQRNPPANNIQLSIENNIIKSNSPDKNETSNELLIDQILSAKEQEILNGEQKFQENIRLQEEAQQELNEAMGTILGTLFKNDEIKNGKPIPSNAEDDQQINVNQYYFDNHNDDETSVHQNVPEIYNVADIPEIFRNKDALEDHFSSLADDERPVFILPSNVKSELDASNIHPVLNPSLLSDFPLSREDPNSPALLEDSNPHSSSVLFYSQVPHYPLRPILGSEASGVYVNGQKKVFKHDLSSNPSPLHSWFDEDPIKIFDPSFNTEDLTRLSSSGTSSNPDIGSSQDQSLGTSFSNPNGPIDNNIPHGRPSIPGHQPVVKPGKPTFSVSNNETGCSANCLRIRTPVCGSDGQTYNNLCMLQLAACEGQDVTYEHEGECKVPIETSNDETETCSKECQRIYNPVCGSDGETYNNECMLEVAACEGTEVTMLYKGKCENGSLSHTTPTDPCFGENITGITTEFEGQVYHRATPCLLRKSSCQCGLRFNDRIVGGKEAFIERFPWQVGITVTQTDFTYCAGSIISDKFILTAAHCVEKKHPKDIHIRLAETSRYGKAETAEIQEFYINDYTKISHHDIALIELKEPIDFTTGKYPICLPSQSKKDLGNTKAIVTGWGRVDFNGVLADSLRAVKVDVMTNEDCEAKSKYKKKYVHKQIICAASPNKDACQGDSGGPLIRQIDDHYEQIGIVSWGIKCAEKEYPGIYTKVSAYRNWIDRIIQGKGESCRDIKEVKNDKNNGNRNDNDEKEKKKKKKKKNEAEKNGNKQDKNKKNKNKNKKKNSNRKNIKESILSAISDITLQDTVLNDTIRNKCKSNCQRERIPVCGTNGKTYNNLCMLKLEACEGAGVALAHPGECQNTSSEEMSQNEDKKTNKNTKNKNKNKAEKPETNIKQETLASLENEEDEIDWGNLKEAIKAIAESVNN